MKKYTLSFLLFGFYLSQAQVKMRLDSEFSIPNSNINSLNPALPSPAKLAEVHFEKINCISAEEVEMMQQQIDKNIALLRKSSPAIGARRSLVHPDFIWPVQPKAGFTDYGYYTLQFLVDHNSAFPNGLLDYNCGSRTYDWGTGNHAGTDIILWPYPWRRMDEQVMQVVAAAPGIIVNKVDGNYDRNCTNNGSGSWNAIHVQHDDGSIAWYLHFKTGSLTSKVVGDSVAVGEYLGTAGSSGSSSWPHLHFQVMDSNNSLIDPWDGSCNSINAGDSWWQNQQPYNVPSVNRVCTKSSQIDYYSCPNPEITFEKDTFNIGDSLWLWAYTRDMEQNSTMQLNIYNPSNQNVINWSFTVPWATNPTTYVRWTYNVVDSWWTQGWWKFEILYQGNTYFHMFYMTHSAVGLNENNSLSDIQIFPNPANEKIVLKNINCIPGDNVNIFDAMGKNAIEFIVDKKKQDIDLDVSSLPSGIYTLRVSSGKNNLINKLVVQH